MRLIPFTRSTRRSFVWPFLLLLEFLVSAAAAHDSVTRNSDTSISNSGSYSCLDIPTVKLHNGVEMPLLILGTAQLITVPGVNPDLPNDFVGMLPERAYRQIQLALEQGVRAFDSAFIYRSGQSIAHVLGEWWRTGRLASRKDVWLTSKIFHPDASSQQFSVSHMPEMHLMTTDQVSQQTRRHFENALIELNVGYIDLMLLHWPSGKGQGNEKDNRARRLAAWQVMEEMYNRGWARAIGVSNFSMDHLEQLKEDGAHIVPMVNQFQASITLQYPDLLKYCLDHHIIPQAYSPLGRGLAELPKQVSEIAKKYGSNKDEGQVAFRYLVQLGYAVTYLTNSKTRMLSNAQIFDFELTSAEMDQLDGLNRPDGGWGLPHPHELE